MHSARRSLAVFLAALFVVAPQSAYAAIVYVTSGTTWTVPADFNSTTNTIEVIGGGAAGYQAGAGNSYSGGGGGGAYSKISNILLERGAVVSVSVGSAGTGNGGSGGDTYFNGGSCAGASVCAKGGTGPSANIGGAGGAAASGVGTVKNSGGKGGDGCNTFSNAPGGGGGAAGKNGNGNGGGNGPCDGVHTGTGGSGDAGSGGAGGPNTGGSGGNGTEWDATHGSGGGASGNCATGPFVGGNYGGGGGGTCNTAANGAQGIIVITYTAGTVLSYTSSSTGQTSVGGTISKGSGTFAIDHPLDPKNKILYHSFVESPDVKNVYDGIATLDEKGEAVISLPRYFLALNEGFRYLGTPIGAPMPDLHISQEVHRYFFGLFGHIVFKISGGKPRGKVSWQVTGIRHDAYIRGNPIIPEVTKGPGQLVDEGDYLFPEFYEKK